MSEFYSALESIRGTDMLISVTPDVADFTADKSVKFNIWTETKQLSVPLPHDPERFRAMIGKLRYYCAPLDPKKPNAIIGWNLKNLYSYVLGKSKAAWEFDGGRMYDLKVLESYMGKHGPCPESFGLAKARLAKVVQSDSWNVLKNVYGRHIYPAHYLCHSSDRGDGGGRPQGNAQAAKQAAQPLRNRWTSQWQDEVFEGVCARLQPAHDDHRGKGQVLPARLRRSLHLPGLPAHGSFHAPVAFGRPSVRIGA
jgi:hypothetical protein